MTWARVHDVARLGWDLAPDDPHVSPLVSPVTGYTIRIEYRPVKVNEWPDDLDTYAWQTDRTLFDVRADFPGDYYPGVRAVTNADGSFTFAVGTNAEPTYTWTCDADSFDGSPCVFVFTWEVESGEPRLYLKKQDGEAAEIAGTPTGTWPLLAPDPYTLGWYDWIGGRMLTISGGEYGDLAIWLASATEEHSLELLEVSGADVDTQSLGSSDFRLDFENNLDPSGFGEYETYTEHEAYFFDGYVLSDDEHRCSLAWADSVDAEDASISVWATIEGWGDYDGQFKVATQVPVFGEGDNHWRPWLAAWPEIMSESDPGDGGVPDGGELQLEIVDVDDACTEEWRTEIDVSTYLSSEVSDSATSFDVDSVGTSYPIAEESVIWVENEAIRVVSISGATLTVTRGALDTDATAHPAGAAVFTALPYLLSRRVRVFVAPQDSCLSGDAVEVATYRIDQRGLDPGTMGVWILRAISQVPIASRAVSSSQWRWLVRTVSGDTISLSRKAGRAFEYEPPPYWDDSDGLAVFALGDQFVQARKTDRDVHRIERYALLGTEAETISPGDSVRAVFAADPTLDSTFFRWSPGPTPSASRTSGTWIKSANWIDIILNLLLSSAAPDDGLELANRVDARGAWDCLPPGIGIGVKASEVDWDAILSVRARTPDWIFPDFIAPESSDAFADVVSSQILRPVGAYLTISAGLVRVVLPRFPTRLDSGFSLGPASIIRRGKGMGVSFDQDMSGLVSSVAYRLGRGLDSSVLTINDADFASTYGHGSYAEHSSRRRDITVESVRPDGDGSSDFLRYRGMALLARKRYPPIKVKLQTGLQHWGVGVGDIGTITHGQIPDLRSGSRGVTGAQVEVRARTLSINPGHVGVDLSMDLHRQVNRIGCVAPSARIVEVADVDDGKEITVSANRYTDTDATDAGLPSVDASDFAVGQSLQIVDRSGAALAERWLVLDGDTEQSVEYSGWGADFDGITKFTVAFDAKVESSLDYAKAILGVLNMALDYEIAFFITSEWGFPAVYFKGSGAGNIYVIGDNVPLTSGARHSFVLSYDGTLTEYSAPSYQSARIRLWLDGAEAVQSTSGYVDVANSPSSLADNSGVTEFVLNNTADASYPEGDCKLHDIAVWIGQAAVDTDIADLMADRASSSLGDPDHRLEFIGNLDDTGTLADSSGTTINGPEAYEIAAGQAEITSIDGDVITVDSDFGGMLADGSEMEGYVLELAPFSGSEPEASRAAYADDVDLLVLGLHDPFRYGEP